MADETAEVEGNVEGSVEGNRVTGNAEILSVDGDVLDAVPLERLEAQIQSYAGRLAAAHARWLVWIAAYDRREGWASWSATSCAHWLNWRCGTTW